MPCRLKSAFARAGIPTERLLALDDAGLREVIDACLELEDARSSRRASDAVGSAAISSDCPGEMQIRSDSRRALRGNRKEGSHISGSSTGGSSIWAMIADDSQGVSSSGSYSKRAKVHGNGQVRRRAVDFEEVQSNHEEAEVSTLEGTSWAQQQTGRLVQLDSSPVGTRHSRPNAGRSDPGNKRRAAAVQCESIATERKCTRRSSSEIKEAEMIELAIDQIRSGSKSVTCLAANPLHRKGMPRRLWGGMITDIGAKDLAKKLESLEVLNLEVLDLSGNQIGPQGIEDMVVSWCLRQPLVVSFWQETPCGTRERRT